MMSHHTEASNGLTLRPLHTTIQTMDERKIEDMTPETIPTLLNATLTSERSHYFIAYLDNTVAIGIYDNAGFHAHQNQEIAPKYIQRLRVFNQDEEALLWRSAGMLKGRMRRDEQEAFDGSKPSEVVEADQVLFGTNAEKTDAPAYTKITEERGTELILPFTDFPLDDKQERVFIRTRNYIDYIKETSQATYVDCRFVDFVDRNGTPLQQGGQK